MNKNNRFLTGKLLSKNIIAWNKEDIKVFKKRDKIIKKIKKRNLKKITKNLKKIKTQSKNKWKTLRKNISRKNKISPELKYSVTKRSEKERLLSPKTITKTVSRYKLIKRIDTMNEGIKFNTEKNKKITELEKLHTIIIDSKTKQNLVEEKKRKIVKKKIELRNKKILKNAKYPMDKKDTRNKTHKYRIPIIY